MSKRFYLTTAIDYVNGEPHLGHAYEKVITDVIARVHRSLGEEVFFLTGLDEHGQKVQQAAVAGGKSPQDHCDELARVWRAFAGKLDLSIDDFIRTTEPRHKQVVQGFLDKLHRNQDFYKATYRGYYSIRDETFLTEKDRRADGSFDPSFGEVVELVEDNYFFKMSRRQQWLIEHIEANPDFVYPDYRRNEVLAFLRHNVLEDLCITRPVGRLDWGIPLPFAEGWVTYVWFDALTNYVSAAASWSDPVVLAALGAQADAGTSPRPVELWPADIQVIGKDIIKFHAVYWPIMLKAMGLPLPRQVLVHGFWQKDGQRMRKALGNVVDPVAVIDQWGVDAFRYYVVREMDIGADGNWTDTGFQARYHAELANGLGNLLNRSLTMLKRYRQGRVPGRSDNLAPEVNQMAQSVLDNLKAHRLQAGLQRTWSIIDRANQYVDQTEPFRLAKDPGQADQLDAVLYNLAETCRVLAVLLWPFLPSTAVKMYRQLGLPDTPDRLSAASWGGLPPEHAIGEVSPLFPRRDQANPRSA